MAVTVRLDPALQRRLERYCRKNRVTISRAIANLLEKHLDDASVRRKTAFELARDLGLVGGFSSGKGDLSENYKRRLKEKVRAKHPR